MKLVGNT